jgi:CubicO group peptidase (beta-lactamase class C family)
MKRHLSLALLLLIFVSCSPKSEWLSPVQPEEVAYSSEKIQEIENYISSAVSDQVIPGGSFIIAKNGHTILNKSFGQNTNADIYRIASMTKAITCVAMMQLVDQRLVYLDDPVYEYIESFGKMLVLDEFNPTDSSYTTVKTQQPITIRNLMTHTSGIVYGSFNPGKLMAVYEQFDMNIGFSHEEWSNEEWMDRLSEVPLAHQPGARFSYGLNMDVMGRIIEVVSGKPLDQYFQENIFDPLGMTDTYFYLPEDKFDRLTPVMTKVEGQYKNVEELGMATLVDYPTKGPRDLFAGGAGLVSTAMDYTKFIEALVEGGRNILPTEILNLMLEDQMPLVINDYENYPKGRDGSFCLGFTLYQDKPNKRSPKTPGTYEWGGYFNTKFFIDPKKELVFTGMTQVADFRGNGFWNGLYELIYEGIQN